MRLDEGQKSQSWLPPKAFPWYPRLGKVRNECQRLFERGMLDGKRPSVQGDPGGEWLLAAVLSVAEDSVPRHGQLHADLMLAAGLQLHLQQCSVGKLAKCLISQPGFP